VKKAQESPLWFSVSSWLQPIGTPSRKFSLPSPLKRRDFGRRAQKLAIPIQSESEGDYGFGKA